MINRQKLIDDMINLLAAECDDMELCGKIMGLILVQPQERPKGRWEQKYDWNWECSNCEERFVAVDGFNFCPNCGKPMETVGADMKESEQG